MEQTNGELKDRVYYMLSFPYGKAGGRQTRRWPTFVIAMAAAAFAWLCTAAAPTLPAAMADDSSSEWGGHIRVIGALSNPDDTSIYQFADTGTLFDRQGEVRIKYQRFMGSQWIFEAHYELVGRQGDTLQNNNRLRAILPAETAARLTSKQGIDDDRRLMNLTHALGDGEDYLLFHRLDRFNLTFQTPSATFRAGRQALTWGNGLLFNPMDLFNPFAPTTIQRDYKVGDDMFHVQLPVRTGEVQLLYLPRRNPLTGDIDTDQSSLAGKWHFPLAGMEFDLMAARHYDDLVLGAGATGYIGGAAWRTDVVYTLADEDADISAYWQIVANMDYAWQWGGRNLYGLVEFYYNGLNRHDDYTAALSDPAVSGKINRGELYTLGETYLAGQLGIELHPLVQLRLIAIVNIGDPSTLVQPQLAWDVAQDLQLVLGAEFGWGGDASEFGGFDVPVGITTVKVAPTNNRYLWLTYYF
ncbi:MAG: hypothetical protein P8X96_14510 [Desulfobacteraceae bacterium]